MGFRQLESAIAAETREIFCNRKIRLKDIMEWSTGVIDQQEGEVVEYMPRHKVLVAIKQELDKRMPNV